MMNVLLVYQDDRRLKLLSSLDFYSLLKSCLFTNFNFIVFYKA